VVLEFMAVLQQQLVGLEPLLLLPLLLHAQPVVLTWPETHLPCVSTYGPCCAGIPRTRANPPGR